MVHPLFVDFFYTLLGKVIIYLLFMVIPLLLHIKTEHTNWRRPISTTLLLSLWMFVGIFERDISDCSWLVWCWMISSLVLGMFSTFLMGPLFVEERYVNRPGIYWVSSIFSASIITSIYIVGSDSIWSILYTMAILILHYIAYGTDRMSYIPIFSVITTYIMWYYCDFSVWYLTIGFSVSVIFLVALNITSITYYESSRKKEDDKEKYAFFEFIITFLVLIFNAYLVLSNTPLTYLVEEYPYLGLFYFILCLAVLLINDVAFCIAAGIVSIAYIGYFWSIFYLPKLFLHLPSLTFSWPNITWNWDLFTFTWCSIIMWIGISILVLAIIISSYITLANYPKRFRAITVLFSFALVPILLFFVKNDSLNWADWTCLIISFLITFVIFGFEANLEDDERDEGYFITRVGSLIIMGYLLYLCHSLKADFTFDYRHLCLVVCILGMYNIVNLPYCIGFWIVSIGYFAISFCDFNFSLPNISFELSWNWDLFTFTWCSVIMWIGITIGILISIILIKEFYSKNGNYVFKYIAHTLLSSIIVYEFFFNNIIEETRWWHWLLFIIGCSALLIEYYLIHLMTRGKVDNVIVCAHSVISLVLTSCLCYILYTQLESVYLLITCVISGIICYSGDNIINRTIIQTSTQTRKKPSMEYRGTLMTCPYCRERYVRTWVNGVLVKGNGRKVAKAVGKGVVSASGASLGLMGGAKAGAIIGSAGGPPGAIIGFLIGGLFGTVTSIYYNKQIEDVVDGTTNWINNELREGNDFKYICPNPNCRKSWNRRVIDGKIVRR